MFATNGDQLRHVAVVLQCPASFQVTCDCGATGPDEFQDALAEGWRNIVEGPACSDRYTGSCPECR